MYIMQIVLPVSHCCFRWNRVVCTLMDRFPVWILVVKAAVGSEYFKYWKFSVVPVTSKSTKSILSGQSLYVLAMWMYRCCWYGALFSYPFGGSVFFLEYSNCLV